ncbi:MAG: hypothetical protein H7274_17305 [Rhodoferax sp.]|nr:hypothetical protein [Rhodoferax sp.]
MGGAGDRETLWPRRRYASRIKDVVVLCAEGNVDDTTGFAELSQLCGKRQIAHLAVASKHLPVACHIKDLVNFVDSARR